MQNARSSYELYNCRNYKALRLYYQPFIHSDIGQIYKDRAIVLAHNAGGPLCIARC